QYEKSEACFRQALEGFRKTEGMDSRGTRATLSRMASMFEAQRRDGDAEPLLRESAEWYLAHPNAIPPDVPDNDVGEAVWRLIVCYRKLHDPAKAVRW